MKKDENHKLTGKIAAAVFLVILVVLFGMIAENKLWHTDYADLNETEQKMLKELENYAKAEKANPIWPGFNLSDKSLVAVNGILGEGYLINPKEPINSLFAKKITMPRGYTINVYRITAAAPQLLQFKGLERFNTTGKQYRIWDNEVFFTRYDESSFAENKYDSGHYMTFLAHEAFHHYMQQNWKDGGRFLTDDLSDKDLQSLEEVYRCFSGMQDEMLKSKPDHKKLQASVEEYLAVMDRRLQEKEDYVREETMAETAEGTATYVGIMASRAVGYDFELMCMQENGQTAENIPFDTIIHLIESGKMNASTLSTDWCYQSGALLCQVLDELYGEEWKEKLNEQTKDKQVTLYALLKAYSQESA